MDKKNTFSDKDEIKTKRLNITSEIKKHIGQYAILLERSDRRATSFYIQITSDNTAKYKCYDFEGNFRCYLTKYLDTVLLMIGEQKLVYLDII